MTVKCSSWKFLPAFSTTQSNTKTSTSDDADIQHHLVLDLDHTLISSFEFGEASGLRGGAPSLISPILSEEYADELGMPQLYHATISNVVVLIKLRPYVRTFIKNAAASGLILHVYTKGRKAYMNEVIKLIDPDGVIKGRLVSRDDEPPHFKETQKDPLLINESFEVDIKTGLIVLDDSPIVWSSCTHFAEIIAAKRYSFSDRFVCFLRSMERSIIRPGTYPKDSDDYLHDLFDTVVSEAITRISNRRRPVHPLIVPTSPLVAAFRTSSSDDETFTPINLWNEETAAGL